MRRIRYGVAMSLDGFIAGPDDEFDWIVADPEIDFNAIFEQFDTWLIGRRTFEVMASKGQPAPPGVRMYVFSETLQQSDHDNVTIVGNDWKEVVRLLREEKGKDIWLFGGGMLFRSLVEENLVDMIEVWIIPIVLGGGIPLLAETTGPIGLTLQGHHVYAKTGTVALVYAVNDALKH